MAAALKINIIGDTRRLAKSFKNAWKQTDSFAGKFKVLGKAAGPPLALAGAAVVGFGAKALGEFSRVEKAWTEVTTLMPGKSKESLGKMQKDIRSFAVRAGADITETMSASYQAVSAGVAPEGLVDFLTIADDAALAGVTDMATTVDGLTSVLNGYNLTAADTERVADQVQTTVRLGKTNWEEMSRVMAQVVPISSSLGVSLDQPLAAIAAMTAQGEPTKKAGTKIRQMLTELSKQGTVASKTFEKISGKSFKSFIAGGGDVADVMEMMSEYAEESGVEMVDLFSSVEAGMAATMLSSEAGIEAFRNNTDEIINSTGALKDAADTMKDTTSHKLNLMKAKWTEFKLRVGEIAAQIVDGLLKAWSWIGDTLVPYIRENFGEIGETIKGYVTAYVEFVRVAIERIVAFFQTGIGQKIIEVVKFAFETIRVRIQAAFRIIQGVFETATALLTGNWGAAWDAVKSTFSDVWDILKETVRTGWNFISGLLSSGINFVMAGLYDAWSAMVRAVAGALHAVLSGIDSAINGAVDLINWGIRQWNKVADVTGWGKVGEITWKSNTKDRLSEERRYKLEWTPIDLTWEEGKIFKTQQELQNEKDGKPKRDGTYDDFLGPVLNRNAGTSPEDSATPFHNVIGPVLGRLTGPMLVGQDGRTASEPSDDDDDDDDDDDTGGGGGGGGSIGIQEPPGLLELIRSSQAVQDAMSKWTTKETDAWNAANDDQRRAWINQIISAAEQAAEQLLFDTLNKVTPPPDDDDGDGETDLVTTAASEAASVAAREAVTAAMEAENNKKTNNTTTLTLVLPDEEIDFEVNTDELLDGNTREVRAAVGSRRSRAGGACA